MRLIRRLLSSCKLRSWLVGKDNVDNVHKGADWEVSFCGAVLMALGGARRVRTADPRLAKPVLSQLSYGPGLVGLGGLEPPTSPLSGVRSNRLSYRPALGSLDKRLLGGGLAA